jgi:ABC-type nickel/cobalt efflux system permease component RcnA
MLASPLDQSQVAFVLSPSAAVSQLAPSTPGGSLATTQAAGPRDAFTQLITLQDVDPPTFLIALLVAVIWGAMHAMTPGHGKTLVGAYLVGSRGTAQHALLLGVTTTLTHTAGVFALGLVTLFASRFVVPEQLYPWLGVISGVLVVAIGLNLFFSRLRGAQKFGLPMGSHDHGHVHHSHAHEHIHDGEHTHGHDSEHVHAPGEHPHSHLPPGADGAPVTLRSLLALGISGGLLPCPSALVVLLSAIALGRVNFGLALVLAFSVGLAATLVAIGLLLVYAGRLFERLPVQSRLIGLLPAASALFIMVVGMGVTAQALAQIGLIRL